MANVVSKVRKWQCTFQSEQIWFVYIVLYCDIEWEEVCCRISLSKKIEQWLNVKFLVKLGKSRALINKMLSAMYSEDVLKPATVYKLVKRFQEGCEDIGNDMWNGRPSSSQSEENVDRVHTLMLANQCIMTRQLSEEVKKCIPVNR